MPPKTAPRAPLVIGFVGRSGVGKTSLVERLIPALARRGLSVGAVKHASHGFLADRPGKDSHRLYESGADAVALISRDQVASFARRGRGEGREVSLAEALAALPAGLDVVLAEGFSWEPIPRVVLLAAGEAPAREHVEPGEVLDVVRVPTPADAGRPPYSDALVEALAAALATRAGGVKGAQRSLRRAEPMSGLDRSSA